MTNDPRCEAGAAEPAVFPHNWGYPPKSCHVPSFILGGSWSYPSHDEICRWRSPKRRRKHDLSVALNNVACTLRMELWRRPVEEMLDLDGIAERTAAAFDRGADSFSVETRWGTITHFDPLAGLLPFAVRKRHFRFIIEARVAELQNARKATP